MRATMLAVLLCTAAAPAAAGGVPVDTLAAGFADPPESARPRVWWHWLNGNITKQGIGDDLQWMHRVGIGGAQTFDASLGTPQIVDKRLVYMTPAWKDAFRYTAQLADSLGIELGIAASPGWSETGGPWVKPQDGLKKLVWSETLVTGGKPVSGPLPAPPRTTGPFQTVPFDDPLAAFGGKPIVPPAYYADAMVLAFPVGLQDEAAPARITTGGGKAVDGAALTDADLASGVDVQPDAPGQPGVLVMTTPTPQTKRSITIFVPGAKSMFASTGLLPVLQVRDGSGWRTVTTLPLTEVPTTRSFAPVTARMFRVLFARDPAPPAPPPGDPAPGAVMGGIFPSGAAQGPLRVTDLQLSADARIDYCEEKAGFAIARDYYVLSSAAADDAGVAPGAVIDLTSRLRADGSLDWTPPPGHWRVLRLGYSLLGTTNHPATPEATGLEVDKFDGHAVHAYLETYFGTYLGTTGPGLIGNHGVRAVVTDSIEVGAANWTPRLVEQFQRLRGYDPRPWLPALTGTIVGSRRQSDAFLYDFRRTLADLMSSEHYAQVADSAHAHGLTLYGEALESLRPSLGDDMAMRSHADVPMAAMWTFNRGGTPRPTLVADVKGAASVAHLYGQNLVAAESFTAMFAPWAFAPSDLKRIADLEFALGVNRPVIHTSVHQPTDDKLPGLSLAIFGQYFNRHETWAEMARPWIDYLARSSYLLQQGRYQADVAYFYGEEAPLTSLYGDKPVADAPTRFGYDFVNPDVLLNRLSVQDGDLVAPTGARYRVLYLGGSSAHMTLPILRRIAQLAAQGATIVGAAPDSSPSLQDDPAAFHALVRRLWNGGAATSVGTGRVIASSDVEAALTSMGATPDYDYDKPEADATLMILHRRLPDGEIYFVSNRQNRAEGITLRFRVTGKTPELWHAETGTAEPVSYRTEGKQTAVPLALAPEDAVFVVFRKPAAASALTVRRAVPRAVAQISGPWTVTFQPGRGAPAATRLATLAPLNSQADPTIRYFSGVATYRTSFALPASTRAGSPLMVDLGAVGDVAEVRINGRPVGTAWHAPYRLDIGSAVHSGRNDIEVRVADLWVNRLIGDAQPGAKPITWTALPTYKPDAPLRPAGLIGPVTILAESRR